MNATQKRVALTSVPEPVSAWSARAAPVTKVDIPATVINQQKLIEDSGEVRFNQLTGKMETVRNESRSLITSVNDDEDYDPFRPNDYETIMRRKRELRRAQEEQRERERECEKEREREREQQEQAQRRKEEQEQRELQPRRRYSTSSSEEESEKDAADRQRKQSKGVAIAPPKSLIELDALKEASAATNADTDAALLGGGGAAAAARMMRRMGYKEGEGLGRSHQGIATALTVEKTGLRVGKILPGANEKAASIAAAINASLMQVPQQLATNATSMPPPSPADLLAAGNGAPQRAVTTNFLRNPSKVVVLRNMVGPGDVDDQLDAEVTEECTKYGKVTRCLIFELTNVGPEEAVRIFVEFDKAEQATKALIDLNGRYFGGRTVRANFYDTSRFGTFQLADPIVD